MTAVGDRLPEWTLDAVDAGRMKVLALLLADPNPLHFDPAAARGLGLGDGPVNQGPSTVAMAANLVRAAFPHGRLTRLSTRLLGSVVAGDPVRAHGTVTAVSGASGGGTAVRCEIAVDAAGRTVLTGTAEIMT